ncbi:MAG TPA: HAD hydrolase-like protein [Xanthomonadales bacterium]|nr:HAD hydrolase-like protein [Xanthomonadales bacterium]
MHKTKKVVLFDIDHTIFDTNQYRKNLYTNLAKEIGHDVNEFQNIAQKIYDEIRKVSPYLTPEPFLKNILTLAKKPTDFKKINNVFWNRELYESCVYPDVKETFSYLVDRNIQIGIFSTGDLAHQKIKIGGLKEYLTENHIYISPDKFKTIKDTFIPNTKYRTYLVDDYPQILESAKSHNKNIFTVFIKRKKHHSSLVIPENFKPDATIVDLNQLIDIIRTDN